MTDDPRSARRLPGHVVRVNGPLVEVVGLSDVAMSEVVALGELGLAGEVVALADGMATVQAYEYTGGIAPGAPVVPSGERLSAWLGPALLGGVFDGLLRPLLGAGTWLTPGTTVPADVREWDFVPTVRPGEHVSAGGPIGTVAIEGGLALRVLVPPGSGGVVENLVAPGRYRGDETLAVVGAVPVRMTQSWPVR
jgi:V/A-type H+-transporting ATPase subunit A